MVLSETLSLEQVCHIVCQALARERGLAEGPYDAYFHWEITDHRHGDWMATSHVDVTLSIQPRGVASEVN